MSGELKQQIRREIMYRRDELIGQVVSSLNLEDLDGNSSAVWTCDVFIKIWLGAKSTRRPIAPL